MQLTKKFLIDHDACDEGLLFFVNNNLTSFPLDNIHNIIGELNFFKEWLFNIVNENDRYDGNGNLIYYKTNEGFETIKKYENNKLTYIKNEYEEIEYYFKYDDNGNEIYSKKNNIEIFKSYNNDNKLTKYKNSNGDLFTYQYENNKLIALIEQSNNANRKIIYEYDCNDNLITKKDDDNITTYIYDSNNILIEEYNSCSKNTITYEPNNLEVHKNNSGIITSKYQTNMFGNVIYSYRHLNNTIFEHYYKYDTNQNLISFEKYSDSKLTHSIKHISKYYSDGQLKQYKSLIIPFYEK